MDKSLASLIDAERQKIAVLEETLAECKGRLKVLLDMNKSDDEVLNALVARRTARLHEGEPPSTLARDATTEMPHLLPQVEASNHETPSGRAKRGTIRAALLSVMSEKEAHLADIRREMSSRGFDLPQPRLRTALWQAKKEGLTASSRAGYHSLTGKGVLAKQDQE